MIRADSAKAADHLRPVQQSAMHGCVGVELVALAAIRNRELPSKPVDEQALSEPVEIVNN
jgi:hypothetical protein